MEKKGLVGVFVVLMFTVLLAPPAVAADPYVVGFSVAVTGRGSGIYAPVKDAFDIYFNEVNAKGGINGHPVEILIEDNAAEPSKAAAHAKKFVTQDEVSLLMNASLSSTFAPMIQVARRYKVPIFFAGSVCPPEVYPPDAASLQYCSTGFAARYDSRLALSFIKEQSEGPVKLGLVCMNIPVSRGEIDFAEELAKTMGMEAVDKEAIPPPTPDYTPFATKLKDAGTNWVYAWAPWVTEVKTFEALRKLGWKGKYLAFAHIQAEDELARLKDDDFYVFGTNAFFVDDLEIHQKIKSTSEKAGTIYPYTMLTEGWIAAMVLEDILKKVSWPATPEKVKAAMDNVRAETKGLRGGPLVWTKSNHFRTVNYYRVYRWDSGNNQIVRVKDWTAFEVK
jgi:ABC-type branched-subunit amino acid transport system substrate-binding protein